MEHSALLRMDQLSGICPVLFSLCFYNSVERYQVTHSYKFRALFHQGPLPTSISFVLLELQSVTSIVLKFLLLKINFNQLPCISLQQSNARLGCYFVTFLHYWCIFRSTQVCTPVDAVVRNIFSIKKKEVVSPCASHHPHNSQNGVHESKAILQ